MRRVDHLNVQLPRAIGGAPLIIRFYESLLHFEYCLLAAILNFLIFDPLVESWIKGVTQASLLSVFGYVNSYIFTTEDGCLVKAIRGLTDVGGTTSIIWGVIA